MGAILGLLEMEQLPILSKPMLKSRKNREKKKHINK
jgi:hypothetical protein